MERFKFCIDCGTRFVTRAHNALRCEECKKKHKKQYMQKYSKEYRLKNIDTIRHNKKVWYENNKEHHSARMKKYQEDNREQIAEKKKQYKRKNKEKIYQDCAKRRALKANARSDAWTREEVFRRDKGICQICGFPVYDYNDAPSRLKPQYDHITPLTSGGDNIISNVQLTHAFCNNNKGTQVPNVDRCIEVISKELIKLAERML